MLWMELAEEQDMFFVEAKPSPVGAAWPYECRQLGVWMERLCAEVWLFEDRAPRSAGIIPWVRRGYAQG